MTKFIGFGLLASLLFVSSQSFSQTDLQVCSSSCSAQIGHNPCGQSNGSSQCMAAVEAFYNQCVSDCLGIENSGDNCAWNAPTVNTVNNGGDDTTITKTSTARPSPLCAVTQKVEITTKTYY